MIIPNPKRTYSTPTISIDSIFVQRVESLARENLSAAGELALAALIYLGTGDNKASDNEMIQWLISINLEKEKEKPITFEKKSYSTDLLKTGRPRVEISMEKVRELKRKGYTQREIADILKVSLSTIKRRIREEKE